MFATLFNVLIEETIDASPVALNAAIFASVLLGSRLETNEHVFALIGVAMQLFALFPAVRAALYKRSVVAHGVLAAVLNIAVVYFLAQIWPTLALVWVAALLFITFICPYWLISMKKYKNQIRGPWDEAKVKVQ